MRLLAVLAALLFGALPADARTVVAADTRPPPRAKPDVRSPGRRGELRAVATGRSRTRGRLPYAVKVEGGLPVDATAFAREVDAILADSRSWGRGRLLRRVASQARFAVVLASPRTTNTLCAPLQTLGRYSCATDARAVLNVRRWQRGAPSYRGDLAAYRRYLVNHEVGHLLGHPHTGCPGRGLRAPVMMQQTKDLGGCRRNPWPLPGERD